MSQTNEVEVRKDQSNDEVLQWVTFQLEEETYGINVMQVREVLRYTEIAPVPGAPDYVLGIINLRGNVVTVIDTRSRFGLIDGEITDNTRQSIAAEKLTANFLIKGIFSNFRCCQIHK